MPLAPAVARRSISHFSGFVPIVSAAIGCANMGAVPD
jgi:hypothetical protein